MRTHTYVEHALREHGSAEREAARTRLREIADALDANDRAQLELIAQYQALRDEQRELNAKVYRA